MHRQDALDLFTDQLDNYKREVSQRYKLDIGMIEDCFFGSNVNTLKALARHSVLVYDRFKRISRKIVSRKAHLPNIVLREPGDRRFLP